LLVSELTGLRCEEVMKTAGREKTNRWATLLSNRAHGAEGQNRSCLNKWAAKQEKLQPKAMCFFLTSTFIELTRQWHVSPQQFSPFSTKAVKFRICSLKSRPSSE